MSSASPTKPKPPSLASAFANVLRDTLPVLTGAPLSAASRACDKRWTFCISFVRACYDASREVFRVFISGRSVVAPLAYFRRPFLSLVSKLTPAIYAQASLATTFLQILKA